VLAIVFAVVAVGVVAVIAKWDAMMVEYHAWRLRQSNDCCMVHYGELRRLAQPSANVEVNCAGAVPESVVADRDRQSEETRTVGAYACIEFLYDDPHEGWVRYIAVARRNAAGVYTVFWYATKY
jgi:hypothetical protein